MEIFQDYAMYYNAFYQDKNYPAEARQVDSLLRKYGNEVKTLINFGCGTGKHDVELTHLGYNCTGIDMSKEMIHLAKCNAELENKDIVFCAADVRTYDPIIKYDAVVSLFHVMSYQVNNEDILAAFHSARKCLNIDGIFLFDAWYGPGVLSDKPSVRVKEVKNEQYRMIRVANPVMHDQTNVVDVSYDVFVINTKTNQTKEIRETHRMRYFFRPELEAYLKEMQFQLIDTLDCRTLGKTDFNSWTSYFIARAI